MARYLPNARRAVRYWGQFFNDTDADEGSGSRSKPAWGLRLRSPCRRRRLSDYRFGDQLSRPLSLPPDGGMVGVRDGACASSRLVLRGESWRSRRRLRWRGPCIRTIRVTRVLKGRGIIMAQSFLFTGKREKWLISNYQTVYPASSAR